MNCSRLQESFLDYQAGALPDPEAAAIRRHLASCPDCQRAWSTLTETLAKLDAMAAPDLEPSPRLRANVMAMIDEARAEIDAPSPFALARGRIDAFFAALLPSRPALQFAFTLAVMLGGLFIGARYLQPRPAANGNNPSSSNPPAATDAAARREIAALKAKIDSMGQFVAYSMNQRSTSDRLQTALQRPASGEPADRVVAELLNTVAFDPSTNVRLSALESLYPHADDENVRAGIVASLPRETSPLVQVAMIDFLVAARDQAAAPAFEQLTRTPQLDDSVRQAARRALAQL